MKSKAQAYAKCSILYYKNGDLRRAARYWNRIYSLHLLSIDLVDVMQIFTDLQVYAITDYIRRKYYLAVGLVG